MAAIVAHSHGGLPVTGAADALAGQLAALVYRATPAPRRKRRDRQGEGIMSNQWEYQEKLIGRDVMGKAVLTIE